MELKLEQFILSAEKLADMQNMDELNPIVLRLSHPTNRTVTVVDCAQVEPNTLVLPINVVWIDMNPTSDNFRKALQRQSKDEDTVEGTMHTWRIINTMDELFAIQTYDAADSAKLTTQNPVPAASTTVMGVARLSYEPEVSSNPIVVAEGDPRLADPREPRYHTHEEQPATQLKTSTSVVTIGGSDEPVPGATLVATSSTSAVWRKLTSADIQA
jgi:hypothetical protein